jgi:hypothetical protein
MDEPNVQFLDEDESRSDEQNPEDADEAFG